MKKVFLFLVVIGLSPIYAQQWDVAKCDSMIKYIYLHGNKSENKQVEMVLPKEGRVFAIGEEVIGVDVQGTNFFFFVKEACNFKGNLHDGKFFFREEKMEQEIVINKTKAFIVKFLKEKPLPPTPLVKGTDPLTKEYLKFISKIKTQENFHLSSADVSRSVGYYEGMGSCVPTFIIYNNGGKAYYIHLYDERPLLEGTYSTSETGPEIPITENIIREVISSW